MSGYIVVETEPAPRDEVFEIWSTDKLSDKDIFRRAVKEFGEVSFNSVQSREYYNAQQGIFIYRVYKQK